MDVLSLAFAIVVLIIIFLLRKEIPKIVDWLVSFRKLKKDESGFSLEGFSEQNKSDNIEAKELKKLNPNSDSEDEKKEDGNYFLLYVEKKYEEALSILNKKIDEAIEEKDIIDLKSFKGVLGSEVAILVDEELSAGTYEVEFDATSLPSGIYFYRIQTSSFVKTMKMVLLK